MKKLFFAGKAIVAHSYGLRSLRRTLMDWREEILNYFERRVTNGKTEGFNRKAKLVQRNAYGFKKFENYRLKLIYLSR